MDYTIKLFNERNGKKCTVIILKTLFKSTGKEDIPEYKFINENRVELFIIF
jgi:hypothetical protein